MTKHSSFIPKTFEHKMFYALSFALILAPCMMMADEGDDEHTNVTRKVTNDPCFPCTPGSNQPSVAAVFGVGGYSIVQTVLTTAGTGTFTPTTGARYTVVEAVGAGGGSGGSGAVNTTTSAGGGSGTYARRVLTAAQIGASIAYTVALGGSAGTSTTAGSAGGSTHFGSLVIAPGGAGSAVGAAAASAGAAGGALGSAGGVIAGFTGGASVTGTLLVPSGAGANSPAGWGQGGYPVNVLTAQTTGNSGQGYGSGASGSSAGASAAAAVIGGTGAGGAIIITEYVLV